MKKFIISFLLIICLFTCLELPGKEISNKSIIQDVFKDQIVSCKVYTGKGTYTRPVPTAMSIEDFLKDLSPFYKDIKWMMESDKNFKINLSVIKTASWHHHDIYDFYDRENLIRITFLEVQPGLFKPLVMIFDSDVRNPFKSANIINYKNYKILSIKTEFLSSSGFFLENFFIVSKKNRKLKSISREDIIKVFSKGLLPEGFRIAGYSNFDWKKHIYSDLVYRPNDKHKRPTGGHVLIEFKIENTEFVPIKRKYIQSNR